MRRALQSALTVRKMAAITAARPHAHDLRDLRVDERDQVGGVGVVQRHGADEAEQHRHGLAGGGRAGDEHADHEAVGSIESASISKEWIAGMMPSRYNADSGIGIHRVGQELHDARHGIVLRGEEAEDGGHERGGGAVAQAVPIQNAQQAAMARPAAAADSSAMPWSRCSGRRCASRWRGARRAARSARLSRAAASGIRRQPSISSRSRGHQAGQQRVAPAGAAVDGRRQPDAAAAAPRWHGWRADRRRSIWKCWPGRA